MDSRFTGVVKRNESEPDMTSAFLPVAHESDSHAANLTELANGDLLCVWFNGPGEGDPDTNIVLSRLASGTRRWSEPAMIACDPHRSEQNPVIFSTPDGTVWLLHTSNEPHDQKTAHVLARTSTDAGHTWSEPWVLFGGPGFFLRNPPVFADDGSWVLPAYHCRPEGEHSVVVRSTDGGTTWREHSVPTSLHRVQLSAVQRDDGSLFGLLRSRAADRIYATESRDLGRSWSVPVRTELPNNNSAIQLVRLASGALALVYNDATLERDQFRWVGDADRPRKKAVRTPLTLAISDDGGLTWPYQRNVQNADLEYRGNEMGYSYPSIIQTRDGRLHLAYSYLRKTIRHVSVDEAWVKAGER
ncbi:sialidase family protein [Actinopolymorpha sp. B11F2]|uniref:sialidase family protein n=1 Tax=Actinopolymorpha sp. B11F2 TaxID=3160862 RepID=UPI0032E4AF00